MGRTRIREVGQFAWHHADLGAECRRCGLVQVYCDFEALDAFRERRWPTNVEAAAGYFICRCGSNDVRLIPVPIWKRQRPIPKRVKPLRPIYREESRSLSRRGRMETADDPLIDDAVAALRRAAEEWDHREVRDEAFRAAIGVIRPFVYRQDFIAELEKALGRKGEIAAHQSVRSAFGHILRQLGRPAE